MKTYKTPKIKTIKLDTEELMQQVAPASPMTQSVSLEYSNEYIDASAARSKQSYGIFDDEEDIFIRTQVNTGVVD